MATFWEIAATSVFVSGLFVVLVISHFGFENGGFVPIAPVHNHC